MKLKTNVWDRDVQKKSYPQLEGDIEADVLIIGGGITGILNGYILSKSGLKVVLAEKNKLCQGATGLTTAFLTQIIDMEPKDLITAFGKSNAKKIFNSHRQAIDLIEDIIKKEKIDCDFKRCKNYIFVNNSKDLKILGEEQKNLNELGVKSFLSDLPKTGFKNEGCLEVPNQAKFHPLKFAYALAEKAIDNGMQIFEDTEVTEIIKNNKLKTGVSKRGTVKAKWVVSCTYEPFGGPLNLYFKKGMYKSYVQEYRIPKGIIEEGIYEDTENPYHFFRIDPQTSYDRLIIGGEDNKIIFPVKEKEQFDKLKNYANKILKGAEKELVFEWSGPILEPGDALAFIGESTDKHLLYTMAFSGNGMTYAGISAMIINDIINGRKNIYYNLYRTNRLLRPKATVIKFRDFTEEFINGVLKKES